MRMGQGVRTDLGHGGITCVLQTQFSSYCLSQLFKVRIYFPKTKFLLIRVGAENRESQSLLLLEKK